jgi:hypothetical protein
VETICDAIVKIYLVLINVYWDVVIPYNKNEDGSFLSK